MWKRRWIWAPELFADKLFKLFARLGDFGGVAWSRRYFLLDCYR
jgi:hypothetical protein